MARTVINFEHVPSWALYSLEYGSEGDSGLTEEDIKQIDDFVKDNFPNGYCMSVDWDSLTEFDTCPAFGKPCSTYTVHFVVD